MSEPKPSDLDQDPLARLDSNLASFEAKRQKAPAGIGGDASAGYRLLSQMLGGVLGGIGLGWLVDHFAHTSPWGLVSGLLIGAGLSIYSAFRMASHAGANTRPGPSVPTSSDDDDDA